MTLRGFRCAAGGGVLAAVLLCSSATPKLAFGAGPLPLPPPPGVSTREALKAELRESLMRKYPGADLEIDNDNSGLGISVLLMADDLTPATERGKSFKNNEARVRSLVLAFLAENPKLFLQAQPGVKFAEERISTSDGLADVTYAARVAGVLLNGAWFSGTVRESGQFVTMETKFPVLSRETIGKIRAAVARAQVTKEEVLAFVERDRRRTTPDARIVWSQVQKLAFPAPPYVRWKVGVYFKGEEAGQLGWGYEADASTGEILRRMPPFSKRNEITPPLPPLPPPAAE